MNHEEYREMIVLGALGALDAADDQALAAHLSECSACRAEREELYDVAAMLAYTTPPVAPSEHLRERILANIQTDAARNSQQSPSSLETRGTRRDEAESAAQTSPAHGSSNVLPFAPEGKGRKFVQLSRSAFLGGAIAASLVIVALSVALASLWTRQRRMSEEMARMNARRNEAEQRLADAGEALARERETAELLAAPEARMMTLSGTAAAPGARARFAYDRRTGRAILYAYDLPPAPAGKAYQLWFIAGGRPLPGRVFRTDAAGRGVLREQVPPEGLDAQIFAVTLEPEEGVPSPTGDKYLLGSASS